MPAARPLLLIVALTVLCGVVTDPAGAVVRRSARLDGASWREYDQVNTNSGSLAHDRTGAYEGRASARATYTGGGNGFARGIFNVRWPLGDDVWFGAAYYLPRNFNHAQQGQVDLLRWDNYGALGTWNHRSGVVIHRNGRANLMRMMFGVENVNIGPSFRLPKGRWFWLEVHQQLGDRDGTAVNEVFLDNRLVSSSTTPNMYGTAVDRVRFGIVAVDAERQKRKLTVWFDRTIVSATPVHAISARRAKPRKPTRR